MSKGWRLLMQTARRLQRNGFMQPASSYILQSLIHLVPSSCTTHSSVGHRIMFCTIVPTGLTFTWWGCCGFCLWHTPTELAHSFLFCSCVCICLYGPFNCILFHELSRQLSAFSLCSPVLSLWLNGPLNYSPDVILCGWLGLKHQLTN